MRKSAYIVITIAAVTIGTLSVVYSMRAYSDYKEKKHKEAIEACVLKANNHYHDDVKRLGTPMFIGGHDGWGLSVEVQKALQDTLKSETAACKR